MDDILEELERRLRHTGRRSSYDEGYDKSYAMLEGISVFADAAKEHLPDSFFDVLSEFRTRMSNADETDPSEPYFRRLQAIVLATITVNSYTSDTAFLTTYPTFNLDQSEKDRIALLASQMRKIVHASELFDNSHKVRILNRISSIENEVLKPKGLFDVILGGTSDIGETLGKFGVDIKPLTDRMKEIKQITRSKTKEYDELPAPDEIKKLPAPDDSEE